jgi:hypothetical protein
MIPSYPPHLRTLFTDRERELALLQQVADELAEGRPSHLALFGLRRIGKTLLLLQHAARLLEGAGVHPVRPVYVDFEELVTSPELFSRRYVGMVTFWGVSYARTASSRTSPQPLSWEGREPGCAVSPRLWPPWSMPVMTQPPRSLWRLIFRRNSRMI